MTLPDLHPDELLQRASQGRIAPEERADLAAHCQRCPACALELTVRADAARVGITSEADHAMAARIVDRVLAKPAATSRAARRWTDRLARVAIVAVMLTSTAVGAAVIAVRLHDRGAPRVEDAMPPPAQTPAPPPARRARRDEPPPLPDPEPPVTVAEAEVAVAQPPAALAPSRPEATERVFRARTQPEPGDEPPATAARLQPPPIAGTASRLEPADASVVFARAEEARTAGRFGDAARLYEDLARRFPGSREEVTARVFRGQLLLQGRQDPAAALHWFQSYLTSEPGGALAEEARLGRAQALGARGLREEERAAWEELLRKHPMSVHASAARARLAALRAP